MQINQSEFYLFFLNLFDYLGDKTIFFFNYFINFIGSLSSEPFLALFVASVAIGSINWTIWIIRKTRSIFYVPFVGEYESSTSVIIPVYREKSKILKETIDSILYNEPDEILLAIDHTEVETMKLVREFYGRNKKVKPFFVFKPGKRPSLAEGIRRASCDIVVLVDSDTQWVSKDFLKKLIIPFRDKKVGGVGTRQRTRETVNITHRLINWFLDIKYTDYVSSDSLSGSVLCLSGRTAAYRKEYVINVLHKLEREYFLWHICMGGDDARLTTLILKQGYKTVYQDVCVAQSDFSPSISVYLKQKVRWSRNSFRTYIKSLFSVWPWKQGRVNYILSAYHTMVPGLSLLLSLVLFIYSLILEIYIFSFLWVGWAFLSRGIKSYSHLSKEPRDIILLPVVVFYFYVLSFIKLYALFTMTKETWAGSRESYKIRRGIRISGAIDNENESIKNFNPKNKLIEVVSK